MTNRMVTHQKPSRRPQVRTQRVSPRDNPSFGGTTWGSANWPASASDTALDITELVFGGATAGSGRRVAPFASLASLKASTTYGDGNGVFTYNSGNSFTTGQFIRLADGTQAYYVGGATDAWSAGTAP